jgi:ADP-ribose pyrophosphatase YjhB (NUDIX family)
MNQIFPTIIEESIKEEVSKVIKTHEPNRITVRAIVFLPQEQKFTMCFSQYFNDYSFFGGGVQKYENRFDALRREVLEEMGCEVTHIHHCLGYIDEYCHNIKKYPTDNVFFHQRSFYYFISVRRVTNPNLSNREEKLKVEARNVSLDEALEHNRSVAFDVNHLIKGVKTKIHREIRILEEIKEWLENSPLFQSIKIKE